MKIKMKAIHDHYQSAIHEAASFMRVCWVIMLLVKSNDVTKQITIWTVFNEPTNSNLQFHL